MADNQDYDEMGNGEFQQDVMEGFEQQEEGVNGDAITTAVEGATHPADSGSAEAPGRDDDR